MNYYTGEIIKRYDLVSIEDGKTLGIVNDIIGNHDKLQEWNVKEHGIVIESEPFGLVFWPISNYNEIEFLSRNKSISSKNI